MYLWLAGQGRAELGARRERTASAAAAGRQARLPEHGRHVPAPSGAQRHQHDVTVAQPAAPFALTH